MPLLKFIKILKNSMTSDDYNNLSQLKKQCIYHYRVVIAIHTMMKYTQTHMYSVMKILTMD